MLVRDQILKLMVERVGENDALVTRYLRERDYQNVAFAVLAREFFAAVRGGEGDGRGVREDGGLGVRLERRRAGQ